MEFQCTLQYENFQVFAEKFVEQSRRLNDGWELRTVASGAHKNKVYLVKSYAQGLPPGDAVLPEDISLEELAGDTSSLEEDQDLASVGRENSGVASQTSPTAVHVEYHIVHSYSYEVPLLYFNATYSSGKPLSLAETWRLLSVSSGADKWGVVTQQEHPYLGRPFYHIHPCHTARAMGQAKECLADVDGTWDYLTSWLSMFGLLTGLRIPLGYAEQH